MYIGTSGVLTQAGKNPGNAGAAYVTRTRDPIITNKGYPRKTALSAALSVPICAICADFVRVPSPDLVHMYIGPEADCRPLPALTINERTRFDMADLNIAPKVRSRNTEGWAYIIGTAHGEPFKVGHATSVEHRLNALQAGNHRRLLIHVAFQVTAMRDAEYAMMSMFSEHRILGEWYAWCPEVADLITALSEGSTRMFRKVFGTGHVRIGNRFHNHTAKIAAVDRRNISNRTKAGDAR